MNITSHNQSGGKTANKVSFNNSNKKKSPMVLIIAIIGLLASIVTILNYFNIYPFKSKEATTKQNKNDVTTNINSPINSNVENQTINYYQGDTEKHITPAINHPKKHKTMEEQSKKDMEEKEPLKENPPVSTVNVTSYNQSGGITANQVNQINV